MKIKEKIKELLMRQKAIEKRFDKMEVDYKEKNLNKEFTKVINLLYLYYIYIILLLFTLIFNLFRSS